MVEIDKNRTVNASQFIWQDADFPEYGEPGQSGMLYNTVIMIACPGCGKFGSMSVDVIKPTQSPSWQIVKGVKEDVTSLSLIPSINCTGCCGWHGYLTDGVFKPC